MGNTNQKGGDNNYIQDNIEKFIQQIVDRNLDKKTKYGFCDSVRILVIDDILTKLTKNQLLEKNKKYEVV